MATGSLTAGKIAEVLFESALETYEAQDMLLDKVSFMDPDGATMQTSGNAIWRPVQQHAPVIAGWDLTGLETGIIEETYPAVLGTPSNDFVSQRADNMRDMSFWKKRGVESGRQQATELNKTIASAIALQGSMFYRSNVTSGYSFVAEAQALMNERQGKNTGRTFMLNDRDTLKFANDLAGRQTLQGRPDETWRTGQIGANIAEFDIFTASFLPNLVGGADPEIRATPGGAQVANFRVACAETWKDASGQRQTRTEWVTVVAWRQQAEIAAKYLHKGSKVYVEGKLQSRTWEDKQSGGKRYATEVLCDRFMMLDGRPQDARSESHGIDGYPEQAGGDDDLPF